LVDNKYQSIIGRLCYLILQNKHLYICDNLKCHLLPKPHKPDSIFPQGILLLAVQAPTSHPLEDGLTPITANQQYTYMQICIFSEQKWYRQFTRLFSVWSLILQLITPCTEIHKSLVYETKRIHHYQSHDLLNYRSWVSTSLSTNHFSKLSKDYLLKFSPAIIIQVSNISQSFPCQNFEITNLPKFSPSTILHYTIIRNHDNLSTSFSQVSHLL